MLILQRIRSYPELLDKEVTQWLDENNIRRRDIIDIHYEIGAVYSMIFILYEDV